ncbi:GNAT family N-acetyltransferase [Paraglaciecola sp. 20A4]|uniref:GNAT family N-acetyltransferase n=1 Tax=Paraglaciecola sp. 20A4 TaxID=2687288 RepID=UPI001409CE88|nr:GNAT family N-acetyltransferase [Paraglaciecola sp. 20A4]
MPALRKANAVDTKDAVALVMSSAPLALNRLFNQRTEDRDYLAITYLLKAFSEQAGQFGYGNHCVIEIDNKVAAIGCGWQFDMGEAYVQATLGSMTSYYHGTDVLEVLHRCQALQQLFARPGVDEMCVGHIGVADKFKRQGLCSQLLAHFESLAKASNKQALTLDVKQDNLAAVQCYQRFGFNIIRTTEDISPMSLGIYVHMRKML